MPNYLIVNIQRNEVVSTIKEDEHEDAKLKALTTAANLSRATVGGKYLVINEQTGFRFIVIRGRIKPIGKMPKEQG